MKFEKLQIGTSFQFVSHQHVVCTPMVCTLMWGGFYYLYWSVIFRRISGNIFTEKKVGYCVVGMVDMKVGSVIRC